MSTVKAFAHTAVIAAALLLLKVLFGLQADGTALAIAIGFVALDRTYQSPKPPAQE